MALSKEPAIQAVVVNHNTSPWTELAMRSLFAQHPNLDITLTIYDNASTDDQEPLRAAADELGVPIIQSGFTTETANNSHGDVLRQFVMTPDRDHCDYYLFLDADGVSRRHGHSTDSTRRYRTPRTPSVPAP